MLVSQRVLLRPAKKEAVDHTVNPTFMHNNDGLSGVRDYSSVSFHDLDHFSAGSFEAPDEVRDVEKIDYSVDVVSDGVHCFLLKIERASNVEEGILTQHR
jgi:hypothetical protein